MSACDDFFLVGAQGVRQVHTHRHTRASLHQVSDSNIQAPYEFGYGRANPNLAALVTRLGLACFGGEIAKASDCFECTWHQSGCGSGGSQTGDNSWFTPGTVGSNRQWLLSSCLPGVLCKL